MFKISLINPPERILALNNQHYIPFALLHLAAYSEEHGIKADIIDVKPEKTYLDTIKSRITDRLAAGRKGSSGIRSRLYDFTMNEIVRQAVSSSPGLLGISCMSTEYSSVMKLASMLKERLKVPIVVGGIHASLYPEHFIYDKSPVDFAVIGEGEEALMELANYLKAGRADYDNITGIAYLKNGMYQRTEIRTIHNDLSTSLISAYSKIDMKFYTRPHPYVTRFVRISGVQIFTSRGCPYNCTFCSGAIIRRLNKWSRPIRYRPIKSIIEELRFLKDTHRIDGFYIMDDTFCIDKKYTNEFCGELKNAALGLVWGIETRSNLVDEELMLNMKSAGLVQLDVGVESGSDRMLEEIRKGITAKDTLDIFSLAHKHKLRTFASVIVNLPNETLEDLQETIDLLEKIRPSSGVIGTTVPLPKTELFDKYFASKLKNDNELIDLFGSLSSPRAAGDERFHFSKYDMDFEKLIGRLLAKHYLFAELQLGAWYWRVFFRSKRKIQYIASIFNGLFNVMEKIAARARLTRDMK
jgi:anaerobic magnesium-protoporphyrin IX monomethyl ester cyclase